jgi:hypothetical protein
LSDRALPCLAALLLAGCSYSFSNPAEDLRAGQVAGRVLADRLATGTPAAFGGVSVSLKGSTFSQVTHDTGRFTLLPLPPGRHTLLFRSSAVWALERDVDIGFGRDGQPEGVALGDVVLRYSAAVAGTATLPPAATSAIEGVVVDEATGQTAVLSGGAFRFPVLNLGVHAFKIAVRDPLALPQPLQFVGGPILLTLGDADQQVEKLLAPLPLHLAAGQGRIRFRISSVGLPVDPASVTVAGLPVGTPATPDSNGDVDVTVPEGVYGIGLVPPATATGASPPVLATAVVLDGLLADLGTLYVVLDSAVVAAQAYCVSDQDCAGTPCTAGLCSSWNPPAAAPADTPWCDTGAATACSVGQACQVPGGFAGACLGGVVRLGTCLQCGTCCTPDGISTLCAVPGAGGC